MATPLPRLSPHGPGQPSLGHPSLSQPGLSPLWRNSLRTWLAATLTIGILVWSGREGVMLLGLLTAVVFINDSEFTPRRSIGQMVTGALIGILTAAVVHSLFSGWLVTAIGLLITGALVRGLGQLKGLGLGYLSCWGLDVMGEGIRFTFPLVFDLALSAMVGIATAQLATWVFWPRRPLQQLPALEWRLCDALSRQIHLTRQWLSQGGSPPPPLRSQALLPQILVLQQLRDLRAAGVLSGDERQLGSRWAQTGTIWRQLLRQWLLLEPLLHQLPATAGAAPLLQNSLRSLEHSLEGEAPSASTPTPARPEDWLLEARRLRASAPLLLAIAQQLLQLQQLLASLALLHRAIGRQPEGSA